MWKRLLIGVVIAAIVMAPPLWVMLSSPAYDYCGAHNGQYPRAETGVDEIGAISIPNANRWEITSSCISGFAGENAGGLTAWATFLLTLVTGGLVWVALEQFQTTRAQLRAYLLPDQIGIFATGEFTFTVDLWFKNYGATPAHNVQTIGDMQILPMTDEDRVIPSYGRLDVVYPFTIGPTGRMPKPIGTRQLTGAELQGMAVRTHAIYVYGKVQYTDAFDRLRYSNFRYFYTGVWPPPIPAMAIAKRGNEST